MASNPKDVPQHYYSLEEYFALEDASDARFEYWDGDIVCMSGGSRSHYRISGNVYYRLARALNGGPCEAFTGEAPVYTPTLPPYRYPDASAACGEPVFEHIKGHDALVNPVVVVEVHSPSTAAADEGPKFEAYQVVPTIRDYLLVSQDEPRVVRHTRLESGAWMRSEVAGLDAAAELESVGCTLDLRDIYDGVTFNT
ncbi:MAG: Uma2 family endonuclease [Acidobacteria bacterium]|nr:Uma2 family endonuclease [Acidobacteriota bacterium]